MGLHEHLPDLLTGRGDHAHTHLADAEELLPGGFIFLGFLGEGYHLLLQGGDAVVEARHEGSGDRDIGCRRVTETLQLEDL